MQRVSFGSSEIMLLSALQRHSVAFAVVGGFAVVAHGVSRPVADLDVLVLPTPENAGRLVPALAAVGFDLTPELQRRIASPRANCLLPRFNAQLLGGVAGVLSSAIVSETVLVEANGISVPVMSRAHLIANKLALGRPKDLADVEALQALRGEGA